MIVFPKSPPSGFIPVPDSNQWHSARVFYASDAFGSEVRWVERHRLTIKPGETFEVAFKREFGCRPEPREKAFVPVGLY